MESKGPPTKDRFSLYADLLDPSSTSTAGTISGAPVTYKTPGDSLSLDQDDAAKKQQALAASLRFQPTKRPQIAAQKAKAKAIASKFVQPASSKSAVPTPTDPADHIKISDQLSKSQPASEIAPTKSTIAHWTTTASDDENVNDYFTGEKRPRGGRKKRKKNGATAEVIQNWDDVYDPSRPNNYEDYKNSDEKIREVREWKDRLYAHRMRKRAMSEQGTDGSPKGSPVTNGIFAPPPGMSFAPPTSLRDGFVPPPSAELPDDHTGDNAYARGEHSGQTTALQVADTTEIPSSSAAVVTPVQEAPAQEAPAGLISRAPVRYLLPLPRADLPSSDAELAAALSEESIEGAEAPNTTRSVRPGQKGFAQRLMSKYGWTKGSGLGAQGTGIINPLYAKADKRKKKSDAEGGGFVIPAATGKIMGGQKSNAGHPEAEGQFGIMSEVVKLEGMLRGMDMDEELERGEGGIMQEIGEECGDKYGKVERVYVASITDPAKLANGSPVFVQFVSQLSALRAVNALEGRVFNGNAIVARFWPGEDFDAGIYE